MGSGGACAGSLRGCVDVSPPTGRMGGKLEQPGALLAPERENCDRVGCMAAFRGFDEFASGFESLVELAQVRGGDRRLALELLPQYRSVELPQNPT